MADIDRSGRDEKTRRMYRRMPWFYGVVAACLLITAIAGFSQAGTNRPLRYYTDDGSTAMTYYTNGSGNNTSFWGINTDNPRCEFDINGTVCINGSSHLVQGVAINGTLISADGNNYPTALSVNQTGSAYSVVLARSGLGSLMGNFSVSGTGGGIGYVNTTGANFNSTNWFIRMINDTTAQAAGVSCNAGDAISTLSNNSVCTSFITPAALAAFGYISSAPNVNVTGFTGSGTTVQLNLSNGSILNATTTGGTGTGNISYNGNGTAGYIPRLTNSTNMNNSGIYDDGTYIILNNLNASLVSYGSTYSDYNVSVPYRRLTTNNNVTVTVCSAGCNYTRIQDALNDVPLVLRHHYNINIRDGTYNEDVYVPPTILQAIYPDEGSTQALQIRGNTSNSSAVKIKSMQINGAYGTWGVTVGYITFYGEEPTSDENASLTVYGSKSVVLNQLQFEGNVTHAVLNYASTVYLTRSIFSENQQYAMYLKRGGFAIFGDDYLDGSNNGSVNISLIKIQNGIAEVNSNNNVTFNLGMFDCATPFSSGFGTYRNRMYCVAGVEHEAASDQGTKVHFDFNENIDDKAGFNTSSEIVGSGNTYVSGQYGSALNINGLSNYVQGNMSQNILQNYTEFTISVWFKVPAYATFDRSFAIFGNNDASLNNTIWYYIDDNGTTNKIVISWGNSTNRDSSNMENNATYFYGDWNHAVTSFKNGKIYHYLNGQYMGNDTSSTRFAAVNQTYYRIGHQLNGSIDDVWLFNRSLNSSEVYSMFRTVNERIATGEFLTKQTTELNLTSLLINNTNVCLSNGTNCVASGSGSGNVTYSGNGTAGYIPRMTNSTDMNNSVIYDDGRNVTIGQNVTISANGTAPMLDLLNAVGGETLRISRTTGSNYITWYTPGGTGTPSIMKAFSSNTATNSILIYTTSVAGTNITRGDVAIDDQNGGNLTHAFYVDVNLNTVAVNTSNISLYPDVEFVVDGDANITGTTGISGSLLVNGTNVCLSNGTNCPAGGSGNVTSTNGTAGYVGVFSSASNLVAMLINSTMIGDAAVNATHLYTSNSGSNGQVLTLNSTGGMNWSTPTTGTSTSGGNASINGDGVFGTYTIQKNTTEIVSGNLTENGVLQYPNNATFSKYLNIGGTVFPYNQPRRFKIAELEFLRGGTNTGGIESLALSTFSSGSSAAGTGNADHPGVLILQDSATALGGSGIFSDVGAFLLAGGENFTVIFQIRSGQTGNSTTKIGFHDVGGAGWATDGCYWSFDNWGTGTGGPTRQAEPKCASNSAQTKTTNFTYTNNTWYVGNIYVDPTATNVTFTIMNETGGVLQSDSITSNIPTAAGRVTGAGVIFTQNTTSAAAAGAYLDYLSLVINRELNRGLQQ